MSRSPVPAAGLGFWGTCVSSGLQHSCPIRLVLGRPRSVRGVAGRGRARPEHSNCSLPRLFSAYQSAWVCVGPVGGSREQYRTEGGSTTAKVARGSCTLWTGQPLCHGAEPALRFLGWSPSHGLRDHLGTSSAAPLLHQVCSSEAQDVDCGKAARSLEWTERCPQAQVHPHLPAPSGGELAHLVTPSLAL